MRRILVALLIISVVGLGAVGLSDVAKEHPQDEPLKLPFDMGYRPFHYWTEEHKPAGFGIEVSQEIARRLGRPGLEVVDVNWSGIFAGLFAKKYEFISFTLNVTRERAQRMDYTEPFMTAGQGIAVREEDKDKIKSPDDFEGLTAGVNAGSVSDTWVTENKDKYGYTISRFDKIADSVMALKTKKVDFVVADSPTVAEFVEDTPGIVKVQYVIAAAKDWGPLKQAAFGMSFRKGDPYRDKVEEVLEGMKLDGTLQELMKPYFGKPGPNDYANIVLAGYGTPGLPAYEPDAVHKPFIPEEK